MRSSQKPLADSPDLLANSGRGLPPRVQALLPQILMVLKSAPGASSIVLLGSAARGEFSWTEFEGQEALFSDLEFMVVTDRHVQGAQRDEMAARLEGLESGLGSTSPLFHIDVLYRERSRLATMPRTIFTYELRRNGQALWGEDPRHLLPDISIRDIDLRNTNEILYKRLWELLFHLPDSLVRGQPLTGLQEVQMAVLCARQALDVPTALLPHAGVLLPTYRERVSFWRENHSALIVRGPAASELAGFLTGCLAIRERPERWYALARDFDLADSSGPSAGGALTDLYVSTVHWLSEALDYVGYQFNEQPRTPGEAVNLARMALRALGGRGPTFTAQWLTVSRKRLFARGLLALHRSLEASLLGQTSAAREHLAGSEDLLAQLALGPGDSDKHNSRVEPWLQARQAWGQVWAEFVRLGDLAFRRRLERRLDPGSR